MAGSAATADQHTDRITAYRAEVPDIPVVALSHDGRRIASVGAHAGS